MNSCNLEGASAEIKQNESTWTPKLTVIPESQPIESDDESDLNLSEFDKLADEIKAARPVKDNSLIRRNLHNIDKIVRKYLKKTHDKFTPSMFSGVMLDVSTEFIQRMQLIFGHLKNDIYSFLSKFNYKFEIDFDFIFHLSFGVYRLINYNNKFDIFMTLIYVVHTFLGKKFNQFSDIVCNLCDKFILELKSFGQVRSEALPEYTVDFSLKKWFDTILDCKIVNSFKTLILNLVGLRFFSRDLADKFINVLGAPQPVSLIEFSRNLVESVEDFISFAVSFRSSGNFLKALAEKDPVVAFLEKTYVLTLEAKSVYLGDDANFKILEESREKDAQEKLGVFNSGRIPAKDFIVKLRTAMIEGEHLAKIKKVSPAFKARLYVLKELFTDLMVRLRSKNRRAPFNVIIHGDPSIGKSSILVHTYKLWAKYKKLTYSRDLVYDKNPKSKFWTNHDPYTQPIIHIPELGSTAANIVKNKGDETIDEVLLIADTQPYSAEVAVAEDKGKCMIMPDLLVIDCNDPDMNLDYINNNPAAIRRRFIYVEVKVKAQYANLTALDESKIPEDLENKMDLWTFKVYKMVPNGIKKSEVVVLSEGTTDIFGYSKLMMELFEEHDHKQDGFGKATSENIEKYLVRSEAQPNKMREMFFIMLAVLAMASIGSAFQVLCIFMFINLYQDFSSQSMGFDKFLKVRLLTMFSYYVVSYRAKMYFDEWKESATVAGNFFFYFGKTCFVKDDENYNLYKMKVNNFSTMKRYSLSLIAFVITLAFVKIMISVFQVMESVTSEGNIIESSGKFTEANVDDELKSVEKRSGCEFPLPKKKSDNDKDYDVVENILPRYKLSERNMNEPERIVNTIEHNVRYVKIEYDGEEFETRALGLCGDIMLINKHCIPGPNTKLVTSCKYEYASNIKHHIVNRDDMTMVGEDAFIFRAYGEMFKDIRFALFDIVPSAISMFGYVDGKQSRVFHSRQVLTCKNYYEDFLLHEYLKYNYPGHKSGSCGTPVMVTVGKQTFLAGIHSGGADYSDDGFATVLKKSLVLPAISILESRGLAPVNSEGSLRLPKGTDISSVTPKSPLLYENIPGLSVIGSISDYKMLTPKTKLELSPLVNEIENLVGESAYREDGKLKYLPPMMKSKRVNDKFIAPYNIWVKKVGVIKNDLPEQTMKVVCAGLSVYLLKKLKEVGVDKLTPYSLEVAQNGYPDNFYIRSMKNSTSGGFLLPGKKSKYNSKVELDFKKDSVMPNFDVKEQVLEIVDSYLSGECSHDIVGAQLKDEPRSHDKATAGKTRVFAMSSYPMTLVNRMYLMPFYALMCEHRDIFSTKVGINMHSKEAAELYQKLTDFSPYIMEGDYGGYDTSMPVGVGLMANTVVEKCLRKLGYNDFAMKVVNGILSDNLYPTISIEGNLIVAAGFQPSGKYATAEDNSLRGLILLYYAFIVMCTEFGAGHELNKTTAFRVDQFHELLLPVTYGDDMVCAVKEAIKNYFNNLTYCEFVNKVYGMEFTTADKKEQHALFIDPTKMSFLKRNFIFNKMLNRRVAVLDRDSFVKSLTYVLPSKEVDLDTQVIETCQSTLRELFFYCKSVEEYDELRLKFINTLPKYTRYCTEDLELLFPFGSNLKLQYE